MRTRSKKSILFTIVWGLVSLILIAPAIALEPCQPDKCTVIGKKFTPFDIITVPLLPDGPFPIVLNEPLWIEGTSDQYFRCDDPNNPNPNNYPCLLWNYACFGDTCNKIAAVYSMIPKCCNNPIELLWSSSGSPDIYQCDSTVYDGPEICSAEALRITPVSGPEGPLYWFTTQMDVEHNVMDIIVKTGEGYITCKQSIAGPGCKDPTPPVRVEPRVQCYQFTAETDNCQTEQTWYAQWAGTNPCAVDVWVADGIVPCSAFPDGFTKLEGEALGDITIVVDGEEQVLTEALTNNSQCDEGWLRFTDPETGCNKRCYYTGGVKYCY